MRCAASSQQTAQLNSLYTDFYIVHKNRFKKEMIKEKRIERAQVNECKQYQEQYFNAMYLFTFCLFPTNYDIVCAVTFAI